MPMPALVEIPLVFVDEEASALELLDTVWEEATVLGVVCVTGPFDVFVLSVVDAAVNDSVDVIVFEVADVEVEELG